jgi:hypothetical protein
MAQSSEELPSLVVDTEPRTIDRLVAYTRGTTAAVMALVVLVLVNVLWFSAFEFRSLMGDDLYGWAYLSSQPTLHDLFLTAPGGKYRPVTTLVQYGLFGAFGSEYAAYVAFNVFLSAVITCVVFALVRKLTRGDNLIAFLGALIFVTSRFSYYNVLQLNGTMEALALLLLLLILYATAEFLMSSRLWPGYALAGLYLLIGFTHERYLVLLPFLLLVPLFRRGLSWRLRALLMGLMCVPFVLNIAVKKFMLGATVMTGTGGTTLGFDPVSIAKFMVKGLANMIYVNWGPGYLSGIPFNEVSGAVRQLVFIIGAAIVVTIILAMVRIVRLRDRGERIDEIKGLILWSVLFFALLLAASITIRQEYRWLYAPFAVCLLYFCYQFSCLDWRPVAKYAVLIVICALIVTVDVYYRAHEGNVFFMYGERIADSATAATIDRYGPRMRDRTVYLEENPDVDWILGHDLFLSPHLGLDYRKVVWVKSFAEIDPAQYDPEDSVFLMMDWSQLRLVDVTEKIYGSSP